MFCGTYLFVMNALIADDVLCTGENIRPKNTRPGTVTDCCESLAGMPISKMSPDVTWEERLATPLSFLARSFL